MKKVLFLLAVIISVNAKAQNLKDLLYSGKLKTDSGSVIRKTDDLRSKIDTTQKKPVAVEKVKPSPVQTESTLPKATPGPALEPGLNKKTDETATTTTVAKENATPVKSNNKIWKEYTDSLQGSLKAEALSSKKVKKDSYYFLVEYEISADGLTTITNVTSSPENAFLQEQVKQRITDNPPVLARVYDSNNKPQKAKRRYSFYITKE